MVEKRKLSTTSLTASELGSASAFLFLLFCYNVNALSNASFLFFEDGEMERVRDTCLKIADLNTRCHRSGFLRSIPTRASDRCIASRRWRARANYETPRFLYFGSLQCEVESLSIRGKCARLTHGDCGCVTLTPARYHRPSSRFSTGRFRNFSRLKMIVYFVRATMMTVCDRV